MRVIKKVKRATRKVERVNKKDRRSLAMHWHWARTIEIVALLEFFAFADFVFLFDTAGAS